MRDLAMHTISDDLLLSFDEGPGNAYQQWLGHPSVCKIARIPNLKAAIPLQPPDAWKTDVIDTFHPKKDMLLFAIGNLMGLQQIVNLAILEQAVRELMREARIILPTTCLSPVLQPKSSHLTFAPRGCDKICKSR